MFYLHSKVTLLLYISSCRYLIQTATILQTDQRHLPWFCEKDQHDEGAVQAEREHRDVPQGLRGIRPQGARPLPGGKPDSIAEWKLYISCQVNDLYENKNLYMIVDNLYNLGGMVSKNSFLLARHGAVSALLYLLDELLHQNPKSNAKKGKEKLIDHFKYVFCSFKWNVSFRLKRTVGTAQYLE